MDYRIYPPEEMIEGRVQLPPSKSVLARRLMMEAYAGVPLTAESDDWADDSRLLRRALTEGLTGERNIDGAGTAMRFLTAYYAATPGADVLLTGNDRMCRRPIAPLVDTLRSLGADIEYAGEEGFPPLKIRGGRLTGGDITIDGTISSQYVTALMLAAPYMEHGLAIAIEGEPVSEPYLKMTQAMMENAGVDARRIHSQLWTVAPGQYTVPAEAIELDWSAAAFWYELSALTSGWITAPGLRLPSVQGDAVVAELYEMLGVLTEPSEDEDDALALTPSPEQNARIHLNLGGWPDLVQPIVVTCCMLGIPFTIEGVSNLRIKECDRLAALEAELRKLSFVLTVKDDVIEWDNARIPVASAEPIDTHGDHRMAMAFAPVAYYLPGIVIRDAEVVSKSYPGYWDQLRALGFTTMDPSEPLLTEGEDDE